MNVCISHKEDPDGLVSAALIKRLYRTEVILADYSDMIKRIEDTSNYDDLEHLFICDLGLSKANEARFIELLEDIAERAKVTYIDHHYLNDTSKDRLTSSGVELIHTIDECTSIIIYSNLMHDNNNYNGYYAILAGLAAITDELSNKKIASIIVNRYDKHFLEFEATMLAYAIYNNQHNDEYLSFLVDELSEGKMPHAIDYVLEHARVYADKVTKCISIISKDAKRIGGNIVYIQADDLPASTISNMLLAMYGNDVRVTIAYKQRGDRTVVSIRGTNLCRLHLGRIVNDIATSMGGSGGGHDRACGAMIPKGSVEEFIDKINNIIDNQS